jgi:YbgC/YbaW family acyl-CoA thioester hydrolase
MPFEFTARRRVAFVDTDMAGIMHFSNYFRFMEAVEHEFVKSLGFRAIMTDADPPLGWPRVHADCDFLRPLRFDDEVEIQLLVKGRTRRTVSYAFRFHRVAEAEAREEVARGTLVVACVTFDGGAMRAVEIPPALADRLEIAPADALPPMRYSRP